MYWLENDSIEIIELAPHSTKQGQVILSHPDENRVAYYAMTPKEALNLAKALEAAALEAQA